jgi:hypothetical protein
MWRRFISLYMIPSCFGSQGMVASSLVQERCPVPLQLMDLDFWDGISGRG